MSKGGDPLGEKTKKVISVSEERKEEKEGRANCCTRFILPKPYCHFWFPVAPADLAAPVIICRWVASIMLFTYCLVLALGCALPTIASFHEALSAETPDERTPLMSDHSPDADELVCAEYVDRCNSKTLSDAKVLGGRCSIFKWRNPQDDFLYECVDGKTSSLREGSRCQAQRFAPCLGSRCTVGPRCGFGSTELAVVLHGGVGHGEGEGFAASLTHQRCIFGQLLRFRHVEEAVITDFTNPGSGGDSNIHEKLDEIESACGHGRGSPPARVVFMIFAHGSDDGCAWCSHEDGSSSGASAHTVLSRIMESLPTQKKLLLVQTCFAGKWLQVAAEIHRDLLRRRPWGSRSPTMPTIVAACESDKGVDHMSMTGMILSALLHRNANEGQEADFLVKDFVDELQRASREAVKATTAWNPGVGPVFEGDSMDMVLSNRASASSENFVQSRSALIPCVRDNEGAGELLYASSLIGDSNGVLAALGALSEDPNPNREGRIIASVNFQMPSTGIAEAADWSPATIKRRWNAHRFQRSWSVLLAAISSGNEGVVKVLLEHGADPNAVPPSTKQVPLASAIQWASKYTNQALEKQVSVIKQLLSHPVTDVNLATLPHQPPLAWAVAPRSYRVVGTGNYADESPEGKLGRLADEVIGLLLDHPDLRVEYANVAPTMPGIPAVRVSIPFEKSILAAICRQNRAIIYPSRFTQLLQHYPQRGKLITAETDSKGWTLLHILANKHILTRTDSAGLVAPLVHAGADVNAKDKNGDTPYNIANCSEVRDSPICMELIRNGAKSFKD